MAKVSVIDSGNITIGSKLMKNNTDLIQWSSPLDKLEDGSQMFDGCSKMNVFSGGDLTSLKSGVNMFNGCSSLTEFTDNLSILCNGESMFNGCSRLSHFSSDLSSLKTGIGMFNGCPIDVASIENITTSLPNLSEVDFNNDDYWSYQLNDNSVITEPNKRGIITFNVPYSLSSNEDYIKTVNPYLNSLYPKNWKVERNIPFYYDKSFFIEIEIKKSGEWDRDLHAFLKFKFTRNAGEEFKFAINDGEEVNPNVVLLDAHGKVSPYEGSVRHSFYKNFIPSHINATEDDGSGSATYSLIAVSLFQGMSFRFNLTAEGTDLKLTCANFRDDARVYIDGVLQKQ